MTTCLDTSSKVAVTHEELHHADDGRALGVRDAVERLVDLVGRGDGDEHRARARRGVSAHHPLLRVHREEALVLQGKIYKTSFSSRGVVRSGTKSSVFPRQQLDPGD